MFQQNYRHRTNNEGTILTAFIFPWILRHCCSGVRLSLYVLATLPITRTLLRRAKLRFLQATTFWAYILYADKVTRPPQRIIRLAANRTRRRHKPILRYGHKKPMPNGAAFTSFGNSARQSARQRSVRQACVIHMKSQEIKQAFTSFGNSYHHSGATREAYFPAKFSVQDEKFLFQKKLCVQQWRFSVRKAKSAVRCRQPISTRYILLRLLTLRVPRRRAAIFPLFCFPVPP